MEGFCIVRTALMDTLWQQLQWIWIFLDGSYVLVHQHASGARCGEYRAIGKSHGGPPTKIHVAADAHGNPLCIEVTGGKAHDSQVAGQLIEQVDGENLIADKGYDSKEIRKKSSQQKYGSNNSEKIQQ